MPDVTVEANGKTFTFPGGTDNRAIGEAIDSYFKGTVAPAAPPTAAAAVKNMPAIAKSAMRALGLPQTEAGVAAAAQKQQQVLGQIGDLKRYGAKLATRQAGYSPLSKAESGYLNTWMAQPGSAPAIAYKRLTDPETSSDQYDKILEGFSPVGRAALLKHARNVRASGGLGEEDYQRSVRANNLATAIAENEASVGKNNMPATLTDVTHTAVRNIKAGIKAPFTGEFNPNQESGLLIPGLASGEKGFLPAIGNLAADIPNLIGQAAALRYSGQGAGSPTSQYEAQMFPEMAQHAMEKIRGGDPGGALVDVAMIPAIGALLHGKLPVRSPKPTAANTEVLVTNRPTNVNELQAYLQTIPNYKRSAATLAQAADTMLTRLATEMGVPTEELYGRLSYEHPATLVKELKSIQKAGKSKEPVSLNQQGQKPLEYRIIEPDGSAEVKRTTNETEASGYRKNGYRVVPVLEDAVPSKSSQPQGPAQLLQEQEKRGPNAMGFYSKAERVISEKMPNRMDAPALKNFLQKAGVKPEEMHWSGLNELLEKGGQVSKADVLKHLEENNVHVEEVVKGERIPSGVTTRPNAEHPNLVDVILPDGGVFRRAMLPEGANDLIRRNELQASSGGEPKFSQYTTPGGKPGTYRELLLTLPDKAYDKNGFLRMDANDVPIYRASHWDEPNVLAHVRFDDRTGPNGEKILHLAEVQSDWHQAGRKKGYAATELPDGWTIKPVNDGERFALRENGQNHGTFASEAEAKSYALNQINATFPHEGGVKVPDAPFKKTWHELALKRVLRFASENGYDGVSWDPGSVQSERYDLSKQASMVSYNPSTREFFYSDIEGRKQQPLKVDPAKLEDYVGKEIAERLLTQSPNDAGFVNLVGDDLKIEAAGMKGFYDKIVPDTLNNFGKRFGAKVGETKIRHGGKYEYVDPVTGEPSRVAGARRKDVYDAVPYMAITPEMRKSAVSEGFPLFQKEGAPKGQIDFSPNKDDVNAVIRLSKDADESTFLHEIFHYAHETMRKNGLDSPELVKDLDAMAEWSGAKKTKSGYDFLTETTVDGKTDKPYEHLARAFEKYMRSGKAPNAELQPMFDRIRGWMKEIYAKIKGTSLEYKLSPELKTTFDRMFGSETNPKTTEVPVEPVAAKPVSATDTKEVKPNAVQIASPKSEDVSVGKGGEDKPQGSSRVRGGKQGAGTAGARAEEAARPAEAVVPAKVDGKTTKAQPVARKEPLNAAEEIGKLDKIIEDQQAKAKETEAFLEASKARTAPAKPAAAKPKPEADSLTEKIEALAAKKRTLKEQMGKAETAEEKGRLRAEAASVDTDLMRLSRQRSRATVQPSETNGTSRVGGTLRHEKSGSDYKVVDNKGDTLILEAGGKFYESRKSDVFRGRLTKQPVFLADVEPASAKSASKVEPSSPKASVVDRAVDQIEWAMSEPTIKRAKDAAIRIAAKIDAGIKPSVGDYGDVPPEVGRDLIKKIREIKKADAEGPTSLAQKSEKAKKTPELKALKREAEELVKSLKNGTDKVTSFDDPLLAIDKATGRNQGVRDFLWEAVNRARETAHDIVRAHDTRLHSAPFNPKDKKVSGWIMEVGEGAKSLADVPAQHQEAVKDGIAWFRKEFDDFIAWANPRLKAMGQDQIPYREDYFPHIRDRMTMFEKLFGDHPEAFASSYDVGMSGKMFNPYAQHRKGGGTPKYDAVDMYQRYIRREADIIAYSEAAQRYTAFAKAMKDAELDQSHKNFYAHLQDTGAALRGIAPDLDRAIGKYTIGKKFLATTQWLRTRIGLNSVVGNLSTAAIQPVQAPLAASKMGVGNYLYGLSKELLSVAHGAQSARQESPYLKSRYEDLPLVREKPVAKALRYTGDMLKVVEETAVTSIWRGHKKAALDKGLSNAEAVKYADNETFKLVGGRQKGQTPPGFMSQLGKTVMQFQNEPNQFNKWVLHNVMYDDLAGRPLTTGERVVMAGKLLAVIYGVNQAAQAGLGRDILPDPVQTAIDVYHEWDEDKDEKGKKKSTGEKIAKTVGRVAGEVLSSVPIGSAVSEALMSDEVRRKYMGTTEAGKFLGGPPMVKVMADLVNGAFTRDTEKLRKAGARVVPPFGGAQANKTYEGYRAAQSGKVSDKTGKPMYRVSGPAEIVRALTLGPSSTKAAGKHFAKGGKAAASSSSFGGLKGL